jgi:hypothetical protein
LVMRSPRIAGSPAKVMVAFFDFFAMGTL